MSKLENNQIIRPILLGELVQTNKNKYVKIMKYRTNLQETAGNGYIVNMQNSDLTEPLKLREGPLKKLAFPLGAG
jgi:hypothetical protein